MPEVRQTGNRNGDWNGSSGGHRYSGISGDQTTTLVARTVSPTTGSPTPGDRISNIGRRNGSSDDRTSGTGRRNGGSNDQTSGTGHQNGVCSDRIPALENGP